MKLEFSPIIWPPVIPIPPRNNTEQKNELNSPKGWLWFPIGICFLLEAIFHFFTPIYIWLNIIYLIIGIGSITISTLSMTIFYVLKIKDK